MRVQVCRGVKCSDRGSEYIEKRLQSDVEKFSYDATVESCLCLDNCKNGPNVIIDGERSERLNPVTASQFLAKKIEKAKHSINQKTP